MTIDRLHKEFKLFLDKMDSQALPDVSPQEIDAIYHEAEVRVVKQSYGRNNIYRMGFQEIQKRTDDLNSLVKTTIIPVNEDKESFNLPSDYMFYLRCMIQVNNSKMKVPAYTGVSLVRLDSLQDVLNDPFNKSVIHEPVVYFSDNKLYVVNNDGEFDTPNIKLTYLKYPVKVDKINQVNSELPEEKQREALQLAVRIALGVIESPRVQEQNDQLSGVE